MLFLWSLVSASETTAVWHYHRHCTLQHCYRVTSGFNGRCQNSTHSTHPYNPLTYQHQNWHTWLCPLSLTRCEIWIESVHGMLHYKYVKYKDFVKFSFTFLSFFILVVAYSKNSWTDFKAYSSATNRHFPPSRNQLNGHNSATFEQICNKFDTYIKNDVSEQVLSSLLCCVIQSSPRLLQGSQTCLSVVVLFLANLNHLWLCLFLKNLV